MNPYSTSMRTKSLEDQENIRVQPTLSDYLSGKAFNSGGKFKVARSPLKYRIPAIVDIVKDKNIIHLGFADAGSFMDKLKNRTWLHNHLDYFTQLCVGIDIDVKAVNEVKKRFGPYCFYALDITKDELPEVVKNNNFKYMVLGELIEHIDNPVLFLAAIKQRNIVSKYVISVPNALKFKNILFSIWGAEAVNSDHRYWFTPYTIQKVLTRSGYSIVKCEMVESHKRGFFTSLLLQVFPLFRDTILIVAE